MVLLFIKEILISFDSRWDPIYIGANFRVHRARVRRAIESAEARDAEQEPLLVSRVAKTSLAHERTAAITLTWVRLWAFCPTCAHHRFTIFSIPIRSLFFLSPLLITFILSNLYLYYHRMSVTAFECIFYRFLLPHDLLEFALLLDCHFC